MGYTEIAKILIGAGGGLEAQQSHILSAYHSACFSGAQDVVELLVSYGISVDGYGGTYESALQAACAGENNLKTATFLLDRGVDVNHSGGPHGNALNAACRSSMNLEIVRLLITNEAEVNPKSEDSITALHYASISGQLDVVKLLLDHGADMEAEHEQCGTPPQMSCRFPVLNRNEIIELLVEKGANVNASGGSTETPLQLLCQNGLEGIEECSRLEEFSKLEKTVRKLVEAGADVKACTGRYGSPLHFAWESGEYELVLVLKDDGGDDVNIEKVSCSRF